MTNRAEIEAWLLQIGTWVSGEIICQTFQVEERQLRRNRGKPGLLSICAISHSKKGFKHVAIATDDEWEECDRRERKHCATTYIGLRQRRTYRRNQVKLIPPVLTERHSGQCLLFNLGERL